MPHPPQTAPHLAGCLLALLALASCQPSAPPPPTEPAPAPQRIVSFVPALTEVAFELGLGPKVVAVGRFDTHPPEVAALPRVGGALDPDLEQTLALKPDLILTAPAVKGVEALAQGQKIPFVSVRTDTLSEVFASYERVGAAAGLPDEGKRQAARLRADLQALRPASDEAPRPKVLLVVGHDPGALTHLYAAGRGSFLDELLVLAGGQNALPDTLGAWPQLSPESVLAHPPDIIIELSPEPSRPAEDARKQEEARKLWASLPQAPAVAQGKVFRLAGEHLLLPGPRVRLTATQLRAALAP